VWQLAVLSVSLIYVFIDFILLSFGCQVTLPMNWHSFPQLLFQGNPENEKL